MLKIKLILFTMSRKSYSQVKLFNEIQTVEIDGGLFHV